MELLNNFKNSILEIYLLTPFICAFVLGCLTILKNPIHIRALSKFFFFIQFFIASFLLMAIEKTQFSILGLNFVFDEISSLFIFIVAFLFLLFLFLSKTFINKAHRAFYSIFLLLYSLLNVFVLSDNIYLGFGCVFWLVCILYFLSELYSKKTEKKFLKYQLYYDIFCLLIGIFLIAWDFLRYFIINDIRFDFSLISQYLYHINDNSITLAFLGFLIIVFKFFNFIPFNVKLIKNSTLTNSYVVVFNNIISVVIGCYLLIKIYSIFNYLFYQEQDKIVLFLLINFIYHTLLLFRDDSLIKFSLSIFPVAIISTMFALFTFSEAGFISFIYSSFAIILSVSLMYFAFILVEKKNNISTLDELKKLNSNARIEKFFVIISCLNIAKMPCLAMFTSFLISFCAIFSTNYSSEILNLAPYILLVGNLFLTLNLLNIVYKILIEPHEQLGNESFFARHQIIPLILLVVLILIIGLFPQGIFEQFFDIINFGNF